MSSLWDTLTGQSQTDILTKFSMIQQMLSYCPTTNSTIWDLTERYNSLLPSIQRIQQASSGSVVGFTISEIDTSNVSSQVNSLYDDVKAVASQCTGNLASITSTASNISNTLNQSMFSNIPIWLILALVFGTIILLKK